VSRWPQLAKLLALEETHMRHFYKHCSRQTSSYQKKNKSILLSIASKDICQEFAQSACIFHRLGYKLYGTPGTASFFITKYNLEVKKLEKPSHEEDYGENGNPSVLNEIMSGKIDMLINISEGTSHSEELTAGYIMRRAAVDFQVSLVTNLKCAILLAECLEEGLDNFKAKHVGEFYKLPTIGWKE